MGWFRLKEDTSGLGPWSMTQQLFFCPKRIKMRDGGPVLLTNIVATYVLFGLEMMYVVIVVALTLRFFSVII